MSYAAVICKIHGQVFLTESEYNFQLRRSDEFWKCPTCREHAEFDDEYFENRHLLDGCEKCGDE